MFDVKTKKSNITITSMMISVSSGTSGQVWTKSGSYIGFQQSSAGWTKVGGTLCLAAHFEIAMYFSHP
jgi:hypothetical protein